MSNARWDSSSGTPCHTEEAATAKAAATAAAAESETKQTHACTVTHGNGSATRGRDAAAHKFAADGFRQHLQRRFVMVPQRNGPGGALLHDGHQLLKGVRHTQAVADDRKLHDRHFGVGVVVQPAAHQLRDFRPQLAELRFVRLKEVFKGHRPRSLKVPLPKPPRRFVVAQLGGGQRPFRLHQEHD